MNPIDLTTNLVLLRVFRTLFNVDQCSEMFFMVNRTVVMLISFCLIIPRLSYALILYSVDWCAGNCVWRWQY
jgi:hypothetical protein